MRSDNRTATAATAAAASHTYGVPRTFRRSGSGSGVARARPLQLASASSHSTSSQQKSGLHVDGVVGQNPGDSLPDNLQGDGGWRSGCYEHLPSTHR